MNTTLPVSTEKPTQTDIINKLLRYAWDNGLPIACWRLPHTSTTYLILSETYRTLPKEKTIEDLSSGFMFAPFEPEKAALFLPADFVFKFENNSLKEPESPAEVSSAAWLASKLQSNAPNTTTKNQTAPAHYGQPSANFVETVKKSIQKIAAGEMEKVVPSRTRVVDLPEDFQVSNAFQKLCDQYPAALVSFVSIPDTGTWLGATPEVLVSVEDCNTFKTVALAGTKAYKAGMNLKSIAWTQKEIEEQALVERYVISCFKKIRLREYDEHGPKTVIAGNLAHLKSEFVVDLKATNFPQLGSVMLQLLHPTSAVCGMPLAPALSFLREHEGYDREFYAGYLGPVNVENNISLFVNLRCMKLLDTKAVLFAGAGITEDSIPEDEYDETEMKFNTLLNVIL